MNFIKLVRFLGAKFHVGIFGTPLFQDRNPTFQMGHLFLEMEESQTVCLDLFVQKLRIVRAL